MKTCVLVTSIDSKTAKQLVQLYATRMQIEEMFRDFKSPRFGWALEFARSRSANRLQILLLIAALAMLVLLLIGIAAETNGIHRAYQANTSKRRVLSCFFLAKAILARNDTYLLQLSKCKEELDHPVQA